MLVSSVCTSLNKPVSETVERTLIIKITYGRTSPFVFVEHLLLILSIFHRAPFLFQFCVLYFSFSCVCVFICVLSLSVCSRIEHHRNISTWYNVATTHCNCFSVFPYIFFCMCSPLLNIPSFGGCCVLIPTPTLLLPFWHIRSLDLLTLGFSHSVFLCGRLHC